MERFIFSILFLILTVEPAPSTDDGFFISAPGVFHVGVNKKVFVQMGKSHFNIPVTLYLEYETGGLLSDRITTTCTEDNKIQIVELKLSDLGENASWYVKLVAVSPAFSDRKSTKVLVSKRRGNIFIQTDQPIYNPTRKVNYRIFTLDHTYRPSEDVIQISVFNAAGNKVMRSLRSAKGGILKGNFPIPDVSKMGTWKITAHYENDEDNAASREFKVKKFDLPSFEVNIAMEQRYILLNAVEFNFTILARYSHGEKVKGAYHCQFGVVEKETTHGEKMKPVFIRRLELTGSVQDGTAAATLQIAELRNQLQIQHNKSISELQQRGAQIYLGVFVTNIQSGEIQETEVYLPIISHKYTVDLSRIRTYFLPGYPLDVVAVVRHPDGSPAAGVPVKMEVKPEEPWHSTTDQEGAVFHVFNIQNEVQITVKVSADGLQEEKVIQKASSPSNCFLYLSITHRMYSVGETLTVNYNTINAPTQGLIYYMVFSRGMLINQGSVSFGTSVRQNLQITSDMVPFFRLIGYYYNQNGDIIADSVWVDVMDECQIKAKVETKGPFEPGKQSVLEIDLHGQRAKVALLAVDKAFYGLNADNKLTAKQVFSSMQSFDHGCTYGGGADPASVLTDAGLSFFSQSQESSTCKSQAARQRRSVDLQQEMMSLKSNFSNEEFQECCVQGFSLIPMRRTCLERVKRINLVEAKPGCAEAFFKCCLEGERLRKKKMIEETQDELGRTTTTEDIEEFFLDTTAQYIRRFFPPSFAFTEFEVNGKGSYKLALPDSITTWEIQVVTLSAATGFCVVKPSEVRAFKSVFVSLRMPYSVKKYEQLSISPVIYNYGDDTLQLAVHMEQTEGLCSPGSATTTAFVNITVEPQSSQFVSFSAVPMVIGSIPIKIRLYDIGNERGIDAIEKTLNVLTEGLEKRVEETHVLKLDGRSSKTFTIDGTLPDNVVPDSLSNIFISAEGDGFGSSHVKKLLSPQKVSRLIVLPTGCVEQTMSKLAPVALALRYLDLSQQWFDLPSGTRDDVLDKIEKGYIWVLGLKQPNGSYNLWRKVQPSNWLTAYVVKVLSLVGQRQAMASGEQGRIARIVPEEDIRHSVRYLLSVQNTDGSYHDQYPVLHNRVLVNQDKKSSMTASINLALNRSLQFLNSELRTNVEESILSSKTYLRSHLEELQHPYAVAITAYCLAVCMPQGTDRSSALRRLQKLDTEVENGCNQRTANASPQNPKPDAITVETAAYILLAAVELNQTEIADKTACWLTTQENYFGGQRSSQDTAMTLEAFAEYELKRPASPKANLIAEFTVPGKRDIAKLTLTNKKERVETDLKKLVGNNIIMTLTGNGDTKLKIVKAYYLLDSEDHCDKVSISVRVEGKVKYTAKIVENYDDYEDYSVDKEKEVRVARSAIEWFDARTRNRRDLDNNLQSENTVTYHVCVSHSLDRNLTGMAIADITLLSGFQVETQDLDRLTLLPEQYIAHYEATYGRVVLYFNKVLESKECISFDATQTVPIGLLQPAPAVFYDYYEPNRRCTVFYSAPKRSTIVSKLCSEDVCQCAERPCHKIQNTFQRRPKMTKYVRLQHACFFPVVDYAYNVDVLNVTMKSNFELYSVNVTDVLRSHGDILVSENSVRVFAKRLHCKGPLALGQHYLIMGKDGATTDSNGKMQYLLESNTWVERKPSKDTCKKSAYRLACTEFDTFTEEYKIDGCRQ
ncbi:complement C4-B [Pseudochaenichthys georgianus]|uniref:complement C4-B n=1 Tax=Pseudochaenichthys georgianus TaxID=52239 RepID=UPI00146B646E|nr:complement C4-B [Pseudochaenichthys georgianus]